MKNRIIVQDNDIDVLEILTVALKDAGYDVFSTAGYADILSHIDQFRPHIVILDFKLSGEECLKTTRLIRAKYPHLPVIASSCNTDFHNQYAKCGFDNYIPKPFDLDDLYSILRKHLPLERLPPSGNPVA